MTTLDSHGKQLFGYHKDLVPKCYKEIEYLLDAQKLYSSLISTVIQSVKV